MSKYHTWHFSLPPQDYSVPEISLFPEENAEGKKVTFRDTSDDARIFGFPIKANSIIINAGLWVTESALPTTFQEEKDKPFYESRWLYFLYCLFCRHNDMILWGLASVMISLFSFGFSLFRWLVYPQPFFQGVPRVLEVGGFPNPASWGVEQPYVGSVHPLKIVRIPSTSRTPCTFSRIVQTIRTMYTV